MSLEIQKDDQPKLVYHSFRFSEKEAELLSKLSHESGLSKTDVVRFSLHSFDVAFHNGAFSKGGR
jgi:hypothetical protein